MERSSGILLHITSLPSKYGIGNLGKEAYAFVDFLKQAGQKYWQILPLCPPGYGDSPYQGFSTFAGNPYLIDPEELVEKGWLARKTLESVQWSQRDDQVDFRQMYDERLHMLQAAFSVFHENEPADFQAFVEQEAAWLPEYALFMAIKAHFDDRPWLEWPADIRLHQPQALAYYRELLSLDVQFHCFLQYAFHEQWQKLRAYAHENGVKIIGDVPIYVPLDSADVWAHPENFQLGRTRRPKCVAGCPPDGFSKNGQYWGNPIYDWERMEQSGFSWWLQRIGAAGRNYDVVRIDHFRGLESYYSIPAGSTTAAGGHWKKGPDRDFIHAMQQALGSGNIIAEDLGYLTPEVKAMLAESGYPGMKIMQFAFDSREPGNYLPYTYPRNSVVYTGTRDNVTAEGWRQSASAEDVAYACRYLRCAPEDLTEAMICACLSCVSDMAVIPLADWLHLDAEARINTPSTQGANWQWRLGSPMPGSLAAHIAQLTALYERTPCGE